MKRDVVGKTLLHGPFIGKLLSESHFLGGKYVCICSMENCTDLADHNKFRDYYKFYKRQQKWRKISNAVANLHHLQVL